jgi:hypothetical protein
VADDSKRIELVEPAGGDHRTQRIGLGLLLSLVLGFGPLRDAVVGNGSFEGAVGRFLICVAVSEAAVLVLGRLLDGAQPPDSDDSSDVG